MGGGTYTGVSALCVYNGELYAGGSFTTAGGATANYIAKWNGASWQAVGTGTNSDVRALCVYNGELYAAGSFTTADEATANYIARWNGVSWQAVGAGMGGSYPVVFALCEYDDGLGAAPALYAGGGFSTAGGNVSAYMARWGCENALTDVASAKSKPDGRLVSITDDVSTAVFGDAFYVSDVSSGFQVSGIRAELPGHAVTRDKLTDITGRTRTTHDGERYVDAWSASCGGSASAKPEFVPLKNLGGGPADPVGLVGQEGITGACGLNNIGMLVRVSGRFTYIDANNFTLDDCSGVGVHCVTPTGVTVNPLWQYVAVTGVSSCERVGVELHRRVLVRSGDDVRVLLP